MNRSRRVGRLALSLLLGAAVLAGAGCTRAQQLEDWWNARQGKAPRERGVPASSDPRDIYLASSIAGGVVATSNPGEIAVVHLKAVRTSAKDLLVVNRWGKLKAGEYRQTVTLLAPDHRTKVAEDNARIEIEDYFKDTTYAARLKDIKFEKPGNYWIRVQLDGVTITEYPVRVEEAAAAAR